MGFIRIKRLCSVRGSEKKAGYRAARNTQLWYRKASRAEKRKYPTWDRLQSRKSTCICHGAGKTDTDKLVVSSMYGEFSKLTSGKAHNSFHTMGKTTHRYRPKEKWKISV